MTSILHVHSVIRSFNMHWNYSICDVFTCNTYFRNMPSFENIINMWKIHLIEKISSDFSIVSLNCTTSSLAWHWYCESGLSFIIVTSKNPWQSFQTVWGKFQGSILSHTVFTDHTYTALTNIKHHLRKHLCIFYRKPKLFAWKQDILILSKNNFYFLLFLLFNFIFDNWIFLFKWILHLDIWVFIAEE